MSYPSDPFIIGTGSRKVICLSGWFGHARGWGPFVEALDTDDFTYAFMDYRGYGSRLEEEGPYTLAQISQDTQALADQLGWHAFGLVGHSMGGSAAQYVLADAPDRVQCLAGITPVPASGVPFDDAGWRLFSRAADDPQARRQIIDFTTGHRHNDEWLDRMVTHSQLHSRPAAVAAYLEAWAKTDFSDRIQGKPTPVLVIVGRHDPALNEDVCRQTWMQFYPDALLQVIDDAGHYPMEEAPQELAVKLEDFLSTHMPR